VVRGQGPGVMSHESGVKGGVRVRSQKSGPYTGPGLKVRVRVMGRGRGRGQESKVKAKPRARQRATPGLG